MPEVLEIHLVLDKNYGTHKTPMIKRWPQRHPRYHLHFAPNHASWLNQVDPKPFQWTKTADEILKNIQRFALQTLAVYA